MLIEAMNGSQPIAAYRLQPACYVRFGRKLDEYFNASIAITECNQWLTLWMELIGTAVITGVGE